MPGKFSCFACGASSAPVTTLCRECSRENPPGVFHDFCEACFSNLEKTVPFNDRLEYPLTLIPKERMVVFRFCPTKERLAALRLAR